MERQADSLFLPDNAHGTRPGHARLSSANAGQLHREKIDFICLDRQATKSLNHSNQVTPVTDSDNLTLVMCSYSASSIFEFATSSSSGEIQVDSRPSLNRANSPGRSSKFKKLKSAENGSLQRPHRAGTFRKYPVQQAPRPDFIVNYLKTATSAFQVYLLPAANALQPITPA